LLNALSQLRIAERAKGAVVGFHTTADLTDTKLQTVRDGAVLFRHTEVVGAALTITRVS